MKCLLQVTMVALLLGAFACSKTELAPESQISDVALKKITDLGFSTKDALKADGGYIVEGDIFLSEDDLHASPLSVRIPQLEQYHTNNVVSAPLTITVALDSKLANKAGYPQGLQEMVNRYNAENLTLTFQVVSANATITFKNASGSYLASAGFPTSAGAPYGTVNVNSRAIGTGTSTTFVNYLATIMAHEVGHCIGYRHTDYQDRSYSCGGATSNEGASTVGANHIAGTPTGPDPGSWMLACIGSGGNRPFNANDKTALRYLYQ